MKKIYTSKNASKLAAYSAMAGALIAAGTEADATIVYTDIDDVTIGIGEAYGLDVDQNEYVDFFMAAAENSAGNWTWGYIIGGSLSFSGSGYGNASNMFVGYDGAILPYGSALAAGDEIGPDADFLSNSTSGGAQVNWGWIASIYSSITYGPFAGTTDRYLGVQFDIDGAVHYGWARLDVEVGPISITIKDMAYNDVAGEAILAGAVTGINNLTDAQVNAYSYGSDINVIIKDLSTGLNTVNVFDLDGRVVYTSAVSGSNLSINLNQVATGLYTIQLTGAENVQYTKKLYIQN
jgi:hypothetical protein